VIDIDRISSVLGRLEAVESALGDPAVFNDRARYRSTLADHAFLKKLDAAYSRYRKALTDIAENETLLDDEELREEAQREIELQQSALPSLERSVLAALLPDDPAEPRNAVVEVRAGTGGEEAALFAGDLFRMYSRYAESKGWKIALMHSNATSLDGFKEVVFTVVGEGAYGALRFESGGHRVQRVPVTEAQGRVHTSAATVVVFPEADEDEELDIPEKDIRIDLFCAGGAGGQHVNKTESAVRMTHLPTGLVAVCQDERSQIRNKEKCLRTLKARILDQRRREEELRMGASRLTLRGSGDRSERIRTYNFPQNRMTDHRIDLTLYSLDRIVEGEIQPLLDALKENDLDERISLSLERKQDK
jgi:peptide chain release factor 1